MTNTPDFPWCIGCRCRDCNQTKRTCEDIKKMILEKLDLKIVDMVPDLPVAVHLCNEVTVGKDMVINHTYTEMGRQMMILDIRAPVSIAGVPWIEQFLEEIVTLDLKEFRNKYILWMIDSFTRFIQGKFLNNKKAETIIQAH